MLECQLIQNSSTLFKHWLEQMQSSYGDKVTDTDTSKKSEAISLYWRQQGNDCFKKCMIKESYKCYTKSVLYAEPRGKMYPLGLANRSAALLHMKRFEVMYMSFIYRACQSFFNAAT